MSSLESASKWNWQGEYEESKEYLLFMKTKKELAIEISKVIKDYDCFEFAIFELDSCNQDYLGWIETETK